MKLKVLLKKNKKTYMGVVIGILLSTTITVGAAIVVAASDVSISSNKTSQTTVQGALDELYNKYNGELEEAKSSCPTDYECKIKLYDYMRNNAKNVIINFNQNSITSNTIGIYTTNETESGNNVYYYRGNVDNNNIIFNNMCWKIVRTTDTNGTKIIYNGLPTDGQCTAINSATNLGEYAYNLDAIDNAYVGYMYGTPKSDSYELTHQNINDSAIKTFIDSWYQSNFNDNTITNMIEDTYYCNDRTVFDSNESLVSTSFKTYGNLGYARNNTIYGAAIRTSFGAVNVSPTLKCPNNNDKFSVSTDNGNGALTYPVALITADEVTFSGYNNKCDAVVSYLGNDKDGDAWTMSPSFTASAADNMVFSNKCNSHTLVDNDYFTVRPVISLKYGVKISNLQDGTATNPYIVE